MKEFSEPGRLPEWFVNLNQEGRQKFMDENPEHEVTQAVMKEQASMTNRRRRKSMEYLRRLQYKGCCG